MSKTNETSTTARKQYVVDQETAARFLFKVDAEQTAVENVTTNHGNFTYHVKGFEGYITIQKSGRVVAKLNHPDFPRVEDTILFAKRFSNETRLMELAVELKDMVEDLRAKARKAKMATSKKTQKKAKPETATPVKSQTTEKETPAEEKKEHGKNALGHIKNSMADMLDKLFLQGVTEEELQAAGFTPARYKSHFRHLNTAKVALVEVKFENGKYTAKLIG